VKFLVTQEAWAMAGFGGSPKPQTMVEKIKSGPLEGCVMLSFPYYWWEAHEVIQTCSLGDEVSNEGERPMIVGTVAASDLNSKSLRASDYLPGASRVPKKPTKKQKVTEAFTQLFTAEGTTRMWDSDPDTVGNEVYWEITDRALRRFAVALGVDLDGLVPE
jgi:hypothetical protein